MADVKISYFSDVLCIWAYLAERRIEELSQNFDGQIDIELHYCSVFPDAWGKIKAKWGAQDGFDKFGRHLMEVAEQFPHIKVHGEIWRKAKPRTSASSHLFLKAIEIIENEQRNNAGGSAKHVERLATRAAWLMRCAFFEHAEDISDWTVLAQVAKQVGLDEAEVQDKIRSSEAVTALAVDYALAQSLNVEGSPTFIMNNGRQKLFGNVGYKLLEANVQELLNRVSNDQASWC